MTIIILILSILLNLIIESTIISHIPIFGYVPNIALIILITVALLKGKYYGAFFGLFLGLSHDIMFGRVVGINGLIYFILGFTFGNIKETLNIGNLAIPIIVTCSGTIFYNASYSLIMFFLSMNINKAIVFKNIFSIEILYNGILSIFIFKLYAKFFKDTSLQFTRKQR